jgi:hypothetical protein
VSSIQTISLLRPNVGIIVIVILVIQKMKPDAFLWLTNAPVVSMVVIEMHFVLTSRSDSDACAMMGLKATDSIVNLSIYVKHLHVIWVSCVVTYEAA